jgi:hypothetical protein
VDYQAIPEYLEVPVYQMPLQAQEIALYAFSALLAMTFVLAIRFSLKERSATPLLCCVGGAISCVMEPLLCTMVDATHAQVGQFVMFESRGLLIPWHAALSYAFYFGLSYLFLVPAFRDRRYSAGKIWTILGVLIVSAWAYEAPIVKIGLWDYYGDQPYQPFGVMPIWWSVASGAMLIIPTTLIARFDTQLIGWRKLLIVPLAPMGAFGAASAVCWPVWIALNSPYGEGVKLAAATVTILLSFLAVWFVMPFISGEEKQNVNPV